MFLGKTALRVRLLAWKQTFFFSFFTQTGLKFSPKKVHIWNSLSIILIFNPERQKVYHYLLCDFKASLLKSKSWKQSLTAIFDPNRAKLWPYNFLQMSYFFLILASNFHSGFSNHHFLLLNIFSMQNMKKTNTGSFFAFLQHWT